MEIPYLNSRLFCSFQLLSTSLLLCLGSSISRNETARLSLIAFKAHINDDPFGSLSSWNCTTRFCRWQGITCSHRYPDRVVRLELPGLRLGGTIAPHIANLTFLRLINLQNNSFTGQIPGEVGRLFRLQYLYLDNNLLQGVIPESFVDFKRMKVINLSCNNLNGQIPKDLKNLTFLVNLNISFNSMDGEVPKEGVFKNVSAVSVIDTPKLRKAPKISQRSAMLKSFIWLISSTLFLGVLLSIFTVVYLQRKSRKKTSPIYILKEKIRRVSYSELLKATDRFSSGNLMGVGSFGSVYKGRLDNSKTLVAVKVLNLQESGASKSFIAECKALINIRHRNLVKILTSCSSIDFKGNDFKALVFEFMPNGSLEKWLHQEMDGSRILSFIERLNIAIDVASALDYLHNQCHVLIVHCDLKPSNVLLDNEMTAHVGDFGLARFLSKTAGGSFRHQSSTIGLKGSIGFIPPEYGMGAKVSTHGDVYSYGILLLELFTGKRPTDDMFHGDANLHKFATMALPEQVMDIVDPQLILQDGDGVMDTVQSSETRGRMHECCVSVIRIGVTCSMESPGKRMDMKDVVTKLHSFRSVFLAADVRGERRNRALALGEGPSYH